MKTVAIIGAGPAGLTAAHELLQTIGEYRVILIEETHEIGGISRTVRHGGNRMDIGGHRFFSKDARVTDFWARFMPTQGKPALDDRLLRREKPLSPGGPDPEHTDRAMLVRTRVSRIYYHKKFYDYPVTMSVRTLRNMGFARTVRAGASYTAAAVKKREERSLEDFYINRFGRVLYGMFFEGYTLKLWGRHPREISADWGAQRVKGLSILAVLRDIAGKLMGKRNRKVETSLIEQFLYPKLGPGQLWEAVADEVLAQGAEMRMGCRAKSITVREGAVTSVEYEQDGENVSLDCDYVFSTMPIRDLVAGVRGEMPPARVRALADGLPYRDFVTVGLLVDKLNLMNETDMRTLGNIVPDCWIYVQDTGVKLGRIQIFNNWSPYMVADPQNTVWIGLEYFCDEGDEFWNQTEEECVRFAVDELCGMGIIQRASVRDSHRERVRKAYPAYFDTYEHIDEVIAYLNGISNLYCLGRNGQHRYNNMDHSMVTAMEAVRLLREGGGDKTAIWEVNTEKEYHEEK